MPFDGPLPTSTSAPTSGRCASSRRRCETYAVRKNVALPLRRVHRPRRDGHRLRRRRLRLRGDRRHSPAGLRDALERARALGARDREAARSSTRATLPRPAPRGEYASPSFARPMPVAPRMVRPADGANRAQAGCDPRIVDWEASRRRAHRDAPARHQRRRRRRPALPLPAAGHGGHRARGRRHADAHAQRLPRHLPAGRRRRSSRASASSAPAGASPRRRSSSLAAPNCPSGTMDVLLMPDQMILQIHESIGHPLELDRILGDERNFAGTSFVTPDMFGTYRYGSDLLNVTFDPTRAEELASYALRRRRHAGRERVHLIRDGILERPLGGAISQARAGLPGVANARADSWNRPPIDRMANLNLEPGDATLDEHDRRHRARRADGDQLLVVDRRLAQQVPVRLRARPPDRERQARRASSRIPTTAASRANFWRSLDARRQRRHAAGAGHAVLRQGRAVAGDPRRPRVAGVRVRAMSTCSAGRQ